MTQVLVDTDVIPFLFKNRYIGLVRDMKVDVGRSTLKLASILGGGCCGDAIPPRNRSRLGS
jgi:hypothetical protein